MLQSRVRRKGRPTTTTRNDPAMLVPKLLDIVDKARAGRLNPTRRAVVVAQGSTTMHVTVSGVGEGGVASGGDIPVLTAYTSTVVGAPGGPAVGDDVLLYYTKPGDPVLLGKENY